MWLAMLLAGCGGGSSVVSDEIGAIAGSADIDLETSCGGASLADLGSEPVCADSGLRAGRTLSIANWGGYVFADDDFGVDEMVALFGADAVCVTFQDGVCDERADAALRREELNSMIGGGRCEGLTTLASRLNLTLSTPSEVGGVQAVTDLAPTISGVVDVIDYWWATQFNETVIEQTAETRKGDLLALVELLVKGLREGAGFTMGIYFEMMGHSLLPVAVTSPSESEYTVWVWDSNDPSRLMPLMIDVEAGRWSYENASPNPELPGSEWFGEMGTIDLTPMNSRSVAEKVSFGGAGGGKVRVSVVPMGKGTADLLVTGPDGRSAGTADGVVIADIPGAIVQLHRDGLSNGLTVLLPGETVNFNVNVKTTSVEADGEAIVTLAQSGGRTTRVKAKPKVGSSLAQIVLNFDKETDEVTVTPSGESSAVVTVGEKRLAVEIPIAQGESLETSTQPGSEEGVSINLKRGEESVLAESVAPAPTVTEKVRFEPQTLTRTVVFVPPKQVVDAPALAEKVAKMASPATSTMPSNVPTSAKPATGTSTSVELPPTSTVKPTTSTVKPTSTTVKPTVTTVESTVTSVKSTSTIVKPTSTIVKPTSTTVKPTVTTVKPTVTTVESTVTTVKPTVTTVKPTVTTVKPTVTTVKPTVTTVKPTVTTVESTSTSVKSTSTTVKPTVTTVKPTVTTVESTSTTVKSPTTTTKPIAVTSTTTIAKESAPVATSAPTANTPQIAVPGQTTIAPTTTTKVTPTTTTTIKK
jgi:hypothetical protein